MKISRTQLAKAFVAKSQDIDMKQLIPGLAQILAEQKMTDQIDLIIRDIARELHVQTGKTLVYATSAHELTDALKKAVEKTAKSELGAKKVVLSTSVDESLLGGVVIQAADEVLDMSVKTKLKALRS